MESVDFDFTDDVAPVSAGFRLRGRQQEWVDAIERDLLTYSRLLVVAPGGVGKCLGRGTPILMFDGTIKPVESIVVGDVLMGPDSQPRLVLTTCSGRDELFRVTPVKGDPYVVNSQHVLSLKTTTGDRYVCWKGVRHYHGEVVNVPIYEYRYANPSFIHCTKGWRTGVDFWEKPLHPDLPPYMLGLWLGDGTNTHFAVSKPDPEIKQAMEEYAASIDHAIREHFSDTGCPTYTVTTGHGSHCGRGKHPNRALNALRELGLLERKHVPHSYKIASRQNREQLLAGILDADGHNIHSGGGYDYITKSPELCADVAFIARSLGLAAYWGPCEKGCQTGAVGTYYRMSISGDCSGLPLRIPRKKAAPRLQKKSVLVTGLTVEPIGPGEYFGFQLEGPDGLFLLGDFTVTHNSTVFAALAKRVHDLRRWKTLVLANRDVLVRQTAGRIEKETGLRVDIEMADEVANPDAPIVVASVQTLGRINRLTGFADNHFGLIVPDEAHFSLSPNWQRVLRYFHYGAESLAEEWVKPQEGEYEPKASVVGFTATPDIGERKNLGEFYQFRSVNYTYLDAVNEGWLVPPIQRCIPVKVDLRKYKTGSTPQGNDYKSSDLSEALIPVMEEIADQIHTEASDRKTIAFLPSVECAKMLHAALVRRGMQSVYVTGECIDGDEKTEMFRTWGRGSVLSNAQIYNFGVDFPDVDCVAWLRATLSKAFYIQGLYRGTRVLPGVIDGLETAQHRRMAIAASKKPNLLILDPLFVSDRIDLMDAYALFTDKPEVRQRMKEAGELSAEGAEQAERDFLKSLEKEARKHARKQARTIDPLAHAVALGDAALASWVPETTADMRPPTMGQLDFLRRHGVATENIKHAGFAHKLIGRVLSRMKLGLATPKQLSLMAQLGLSETYCTTLSIAEATAAIDAAITKRKSYAPNQTEATPSA